MTASLFFSPNFADDVDRGRTAARASDETASAHAYVHEAHETALLARLRTGDETAFAEMFRLYTPNMYQVAVALLGSADAAADVVQMVMLRVWQQRTTIVLHRSFGAYLRSATVNTARNALRGDARARDAAKRAATSLIPMTREAVSDPTDPLDDETDLDIRRAIVLEHAIEALPGRTREIFLLWWGGQLSYAEIAQAMGISVKGVERARARALVALREALVNAGLGPTSPP